MSRLKEIGDQILDHTDRLPSTTVGTTLVNIALDVVNKIPNVGREKRKSRHQILQETNLPLVITPIPPEEKTARRQELGAFTVNETIRLLENAHAVQVEREDDPFIPGRHSDGHNVVLVGNLVAQQQFVLGGLQIIDINERLQQARELNQQEEKPYNGFDYLPLYSPNMTAGFEQGKSILEQEANPTEK